MQEYIEIPRGCTATRTMLGVPTEVAMVVGALAIIPVLAFRSPWLLLIMPVIWGFMKYHATRDPQFLQIWSGQLQFAAYYHA